MFAAIEGESDAIDRKTNKKIYSARAKFVYDFLLEKVFQKIECRMALAHVSWEEAG